MPSPTIGQPAAAQWTRSWWVRPVWGSSASQARRSSSRPSTRQVVAAGWPLLELGPRLRSLEDLLVQIVGEGTA